MPNPSITITAQAQADPLPPSANGILAYVLGPDIARGMQTLPTPCAAEIRDPVRKVELDAENVGLVRITYELSSYKHRRNSFWHWRAVHAEKV